MEIKQEVNAISSLNALLLPFFILYQYFFEDL